MTEREIGRLMVIDDEIDFVAFVRESAEQAGFVVRSAENGKVAREAYLKFKPEVVVLDVAMPECDGIDFVRWLAGQDKPERLIVATGYFPQYGKAAATLATIGGTGTVRVLWKPVRLATLLEAIMSPGGSSMPLAVGDGRGHN